MMGSTKLGRKSESESESGGLGNDWSCILCECGGSDNIQSGDIQGLRMLLRYLGINSTRVFPNSSGGLTSEDNNNDNSMDCSWDEYEYHRMCIDCWRLTNNFVQNYKDYEIRRLALDKSVFSVRQHLECSRRSKRSSGEAGVAEDVDKGTLTQVVLRKCIQKLAAIVEPVVPGGGVTQEAEDQQSCTPTLTSLIPQPATEDNTTTADNSKCMTLEVAEMTINLNYFESGDNLGSYKCVHCGLTSAKRNYIWVHMRVMHPLQYYSALVAPGTTAQSAKLAVQQALSKLVGLNLGNNRGCLQCPYCPFFSNAKWTCQRHMLEDHASTLFPQLDEEPSKEPAGTTPISTTNTTAIAGPVQGSSCACLYCDRVFTEDTEYLDHLFRRHPFQFCRSHGLHHDIDVTQDQANLVIQLAYELIEQNDDDLRFQCFACSATFRQKLSCRRHVLLEHYSELVFEAQKEIGASNQQQLLGASDDGNERCSASQTELACPKKEVDTEQEEMDIGKLEMNPTTPAVPAAALPTQIKTEPMDTNEVDESQTQIATKMNSNGTSTSSSTSDLNAEIIPSDPVTIDDNKDEEEETSKSKQLGVGVAVPLPRYECPFCQQKFFNNMDRKHHLTANHRLQTCFINFPTRATKSELRLALERLMLRVNSSIGVRYRCNARCRCLSKSRYHTSSLTSMYYHLRNSHMPAILEELEKVRAKTDMSLCPHCRQHIGNLSFEQHVQVEHPFQAFASILPPSMTKSSWSASIQHLIDRQTRSQRRQRKEDPSSQSKSQYYSCCSTKFPRMRDLRAHLIMCHTPDIILELSLINNNKD